MDKFQTFEEFLVSQSAHIDHLDFIINLLIAAFLGYLLAVIYKRCASTLSNKIAFAKNLLIVTMTTMLIITIVKSSLALSLGLVGALSIVRFRTPIKEPEDLSYLFLSIAVGLGLGAGQRLVVVIGFVLIATIIMMRKSSKQQQANNSMQLLVNIDNPDENSLDEVIAELQKNCQQLKLRRLDHSATQMQGDFWILFEDMAQINAAKQSLLKFGDKVAISLLDSRNI